MTEATLSVALKPKDSAVAPVKARSYWRRVGRRLRYQYIKVTLETHTQRLRIYHNGHLIKQCAFQLRIA